MGKDTNLMANGQIIAKFSLKMWPGELWKDEIREGRYERNYNNYSV
jgi:hypothetical protein